VRSQPPFPGRYSLLLSVGKPPWSLVSSKYDLQDGTRIDFMEGGVLYQRQGSVFIDRIGLDGKGRLSWKRQLPRRGLRNPSERTWL
jgi:hypothetical protein